MIKILTLLLCVTLAHADVDPSNKKKFGDATSSDKIIEANIGNGSLNPKLRFHLGAWDFTNDGSTFTALGSGGGGSSLPPSTGPVELLGNPGFESGAITNGWSTTGGTAVLVTSGANLLFGTNSASWVASGSGQFFKSTAYTVQGLAGGICEAQIYYLYSGTNGDYTMEAFDGSSVLASAALQNQTVSANPITIGPFACGASYSSTLQFRLKSNVASPGTIYFDGTHLGSVGPSHAGLYAGVIWPATASCVWDNGSTNQSFTSFTVNANCTFPTGGNLIRSGLAPASKLPAIKITNLPSGEYLVIATGVFGTQTTSACSWRFSDGSNFTQPEVIVSGATNMDSNIILGHFSYSTPGDRTIELQATGFATSADCQITDSQPTTSSLEILVYRQ